MTVPAIQVGFKGNRFEEITEKSYFSALHYAARTGDLAIFKLLADAGADLNSQTNGGVTAFHRAAMQGHDNIVAFLLQKPLKINPDLVDSDLKTALHRAAENGRVSTVKLIISAGLQHLKQARDLHERTPFDLVPQSDQYDELRNELVC